MDARDRRARASTYMAFAVQGREAATGQSMSLRRIPRTASTSPSTAVKPPNRFTTPAG